MPFLSAALSRKGWEWNNLVGLVVSHPSRDEAARRMGQRVFLGDGGYWASLHGFAFWGFACCSRRPCPRPMDGDPSAGPGARSIGVSPITTPSSRTTGSLGPRLPRGRGAGSLRPRVVVQSSFVQSCNLPVVDTRFPKTRGRGRPHVKGHPRPWSPALRIRHKLNLALQSGDSHLSMLLA